MNQTANTNDTSWQRDAEWYDTITGDTGHYYHEHVILPNAIRLLRMEPQDTIIDVGCGQGVFARTVDPKVEYTGIDAADSLVIAARKRDASPAHRYLVADATTEWPTAAGTGFTKGIALLSLQNMSRPDQVLKQVGKHMAKDGVFLLVLNHPCFRIPKFSAWGIDEKTNIQYRRVDKYLSSAKIPIEMRPGAVADNDQGSISWSFHFSLQELSKMLALAKLSIILIEEWKSDKTSVGTAAERENFARNEIPMFLAILVTKK